LHHVQSEQIIPLESAPDLGFWQQDEEGVHAKSSSASALSALVDFDVLRL
jgi:hypothetical protein